MLKIVGDGWMDTQVLIILFFLHLYMIELFQNK